MKKKNCWEFMECGRAPGGAREHELGACPAATDKRFNGVNDGMNAGRLCWKVAGTFCEGEAQGTFTEKILSCLDCSFYKEVVFQEGSFFLFAGHDVGKEGKEPA